MDAGAEASARELGLLAGRVGLGLMMLLAHGMPKLNNFAAISSKFPDPLGVGSQLSLSLAIFSEVFCAGLLLLGLGTRLAASQLIITMAVAAFVVHGADPFFAPPGQASKEFALVYLTGFLVLFLTGPGKFSIDRAIAAKVSA